MNRRPVPGRAGAGGPHRHGPRLRPVLLRWSPQASGLRRARPKRYWITIASAAAAPAVQDESRGAVLRAADRHDYYVNDAAWPTTSTPPRPETTANTGKTPGDPKANLLPLLRGLLDLGPGDVVQIDTGNYIHVRNVVISGTLTLGNDEGATFTGPTGPRARSPAWTSPTAGSTNIELNDGDYVTLDTSR